MRIPETLAQRIELFRHKGRVFRPPEDLFTEDSWLAVMLGQEILPEGWDPLVDAIPPDQLKAYLAYLRGQYASVALSMPTHAQYLDKFCVAESGR
jgi:tryptophan halogenase